MGELLALIVILLLVVMVWSFPLYFGLNLVLWLFGSTLRITLFQSFGLCLLAKIIQSILFKKGDD